MKQQTTRHGYSVNHDWKAEKPLQVKPEVKREYFEDGVRMYETKDKRVFLADTFDKIFKGVKLKVKTLRQEKAERHRKKRFSCS